MGDGPKLKSDYLSSTSASTKVKDGIAVASVTAVTAGLWLGPVTFASPWLLSAIAAVAPMWFLLKTIPPKPREVILPTLRLLFGLSAQRQQPAQMPLWQKILKLSIPAAFIVGAAQPQWKPEQPIEGQGPVMLVVDDGAYAGRNWAARTEQMKNLIDQAEHANRPVIILPTSAPADAGQIKAPEPLIPAEARRIALDMKPHSWAVDRKAALAALESGTLPATASVVWLSDGVNDEGAADFAKKLKTLGPLTVLRDPATVPARLITPVEAVDQNLRVTIHRADSEKEETVNLTASDDKGRDVDEVQAHFKPGQTRTEAVFELSGEQRNRLERIAVRGDNSAAGTMLLDERWRRRPVGMIKSGAGGDVQTLLSESRFIEQALDRHVDMHVGNVEDLLKNEIAVMMMTDAAAVSDADRKRLDEWVKTGGTLLHFAGPNMLTRQPARDDLLPIQINQTAKRWDGTFSGGKPARIDAFPPTSPFADIKVPSDVTVDRIVTPRSSAQGDEEVWAHLDDGSPLVTAKKHGEGWNVLVHTTANREWSNWVLSDLFINMMRAVVSHSQGAAKGDGPAGWKMPPVKIMNGHGQLMSPSPSVRELTRDIRAAGTVGPRNPPGFYGNESVRYAHNFTNAAAELKPLPPMPEGVKQAIYSRDRQDFDFRGPAWGLALSLLLVDVLIMMAQRGKLPGFGGAGPAGAAVRRKNPEPV